MDSIYIKSSIIFIFLFSLCFGQYANNIVPNGTCELDANWGGSGLDGGETNERSSAQVYEGTYSRHILVDEAYEGARSDAYSSAITLGTTYRTEAFVYVVSGAAYVYRSNARVDYNMPTTTTGSWEHLQSTNTATSDGSIYVLIRSTAAGGAEFYFDNISSRIKLDTLWIDTNQSDDTDNDSTKTLTEAFETRGAHSGGTFIVCAGTYSESITIDSSFSKLEASGTASIGAIDFNDKTVTVDLANLTIISKTNDSNVTYLNAPSTSTESGSGYNNWGGFNGYLQSSIGISTTPTDTTITLAITNSTANSTDSVDVTGTNDLLVFTDSTYWLINQADVAVTWANADVIDKFDGWQSLDTLLHGQSSNGYVRLGLACLDTSGDTTSISQYRFRVNVFDETAPSPPAIVATGVQYDSVNIALTHAGETGAYMQVRYGSSVADTKDGTLLIDWYTLGNLDTTLLFNVGQDSTVNFYVFAKDSLNNVSSPKYG